jgi:hypothetical protein
MVTKFSKHTGKSAKLKHGQDMGFLLHHGGRQLTYYEIDFKTELSTA